MNPFLRHGLHHESSFDEQIARLKHAHDWLISADKIFASNIKGFEDYSKFFGLKYRISKFSLFDKTKVSDSAVNAENVEIYIAPGRHCAMLQGRLAKCTIIPKITLKKVQNISGELTVLDEKEFSQCVIQSYQEELEIITFTFKYTSFSDAYTDHKEDGVKLGTAATKIDLANWKVESS